MERMRNMARYYRFSKPVSDEESAEILKEMRDLEDIKMAEITDGPRIPGSRDPG